MGCSVTWYSRVATTHVTTTSPTHSPSPPIHSPSSPAHKSPYASCPPTRLTYSPPVLWSTQLPNLPPFPAHSGMRRDAAPASSSPSCALFFLFSSFCFFISFSFHFVPGDRSLSLTGTRDPLQRANARGGEAATTLQPPVPPLSNPVQGTAAVAFPLSRRPRHARRSLRPPVHCPIMGFGLVSELSTSFLTSR
jgi:hypothetical protein